MSILQEVETCREMVDKLPQAFLPDQAGDMDAIFQFNIGDPENFIFHLVIKDGQCQSFENEAENPDVTVHTPTDVWVQVIRGELDGATGVMMGQFSFEGDLALLQELKVIFGLV